MDKQFAFVYLAGGLRSNWQESIITKCCDTKLHFFNPKKHNLELDPKLYTTWDLFYVSKCDILFAYMENDNPSGIGLSIEIGFAKGLGKTIILVDEKSNENKDFARYFKIIRECSNVVFNELESGIAFLKRFSIEM